MHFCQVLLHNHLHKINIVAILIASMAVDHGLFCENQDDL